MPSFGRRLLGAGYVVLNVIRAMNIIGLLSVIAASSVMLVKTFIISKFFFFDACEHVVRIIMAGFLILTELPLFKSYISRNWPLFSPRSGFVMLGFAMIFLGNSILGNLNKEATSQESLGMAFWRLVIASGIIVLVLGPINILASYIFRDHKSHVTARQVRSDGAVASHKADVEASTPKPPSRKSRYRSFLLGNRRDSLPSYYSGKTAKHNDMVQTPKIHTAISNPFSQDSTNSRVAQSPGGSSSKYSHSPKSERYFQSPDMSRPQLARHPAMTDGHAL
ncbi:hypothetical protein PV10_04915 [Exophiala mesophila]|uniref:DUF7598 domain-containing protein n=1 Tax=Exophiala mesophila TaxID=212818 RepID=A0A0D1WWF2_EXOME|nr:uncharacterized protein PV10_04915 [Exophiala mesophila]KIV93720.1 hypothetical protein PV10_04915 [Exophiala mesophila]